VRVSTFGVSIAAWVLGGIVGALLAKKHRVIGFGIGALIAGPIADTAIERAQLRLGQGG